MNKKRSDGAYIENESAFDWSRLRPIEKRKRERVQSCQENVRPLLYKHNRIALSSF